MTIHKATIVWDNQKHITVHLGMTNHEGESDTAYLRKCVEFFEMNKSGPNQHLILERLAFIEAGRAYQKMHDLGMSDAQIAKQVGKNRSSVANTRRLLILPEDEQDQVNTGDLSERQALALVPLYQLPSELTDQMKNHWLWERLNQPTELTSNRIRGCYKQIVETYTKQIKWSVTKETCGVDPRSLRCTDCPKFIKLSTNHNACADDVCFEDKLMYLKCQQMDVAAVATGLPGLSPHGNFSNLVNFWNYRENDLVACQAAQDNNCPNLHLYYGQYNQSYHHSPDGQPDQIVYVCKGEGNECECIRAASRDPNAPDEATVNKAEKKRQANLSRMRDQTANALTLEIQKLPMSMIALFGDYILYNNKKILSAMANDEPDLMASIIATKLAGDTVLNWMDVTRGHQELTDWLTPLGLGDIVPTLPIEVLELRLENLIAWINSSIKAATKEKLTEKRAEGVDIQDKLPVNMKDQATLLIEAIDLYLGMRTH